MTETTPTFLSLGVPAPIAEALARNGKTEPFPIQRDTLPDTLAGRDVLGRGRTGSGKTIAFGIPLVARLATDVVAKRRPSRPRAIVLAPTRELVTQIAETIKMLADPVGVKVTTIFGGIPQRRQELALEGGIDVVVAAPGRLDDLLKQGVVSLDGVEVTVLDEADHMADMGFLPVVTRILNKTPKVGQRLLFSATLDNGVDNIVKKYLHDPIRHSVDSAESPVPQLTHHVFEVAGKDQKDALIEALASGTGRRIFFTRMKHQAKRLAKQLSASGIPAVELQGNLSQNARDRNLAEFVSGDAKVLVATDVAARGVHVDGVELVVHIDPPVEHKAYLHRSGRTARAGNEGDVVTVVLPEQRGEMRQIMRAAKINVTPRQVNPNAATVDPEVLSLIGEVAPRVDPREIERRRAEAQNAQQRAAGHSPAGQGNSTGANAKRKRSRGGQGRGGQGQSGQNGQGQGRGGQGGQGRPAQAGAAGGGRGRGGQSQGGQGQPRQRSQGGESGGGQRRSGRRAQGGGSVYSTSSSGS
ncbi:superfamily II DNA/RNA helicase [Leucobacter luti]|uniref:DEAD/DEAH box helicase n=1 Tax=Leucobacter luti TaxID=340320 RepID=UPI001048463C|nr:DEAD/DEAH box helicase [Leucobacter luti]MCW2288216.1 superfamily II DNA/RNA helicase [Leucobacter luti]TCK45625.1 superfamily II DNA/RNA helicase [Leucobacter luti]